MPGDETGSCGWPVNWNRTLRGMCLDLEHAYKPLVRHPCDNWVSVIAAVNPEDAQVYLFEAVSLPFGSVSSVIAFNRVARALRVILSKFFFMLVVAIFFNDFCQLELEILSNSAHKTAELCVGAAWMGDFER